MELAARISLMHACVRGAFSITKTSDAKQWATRNPFGVQDVPDPDGQDVKAFTAEAELKGSDDDANAERWSNKNEKCDSIEGSWSSRWNGGADPTIPGDRADKWKEGKVEVKTTGHRAYLFFDWDNRARKGLIDAQFDGGERMIGRYMNLNDPTIMRPRFGLILNNQRIDGRFPEGRLDSRR